MESPSQAEWGGQLEIQALCAALGRVIYIYSADAPVLKMGEEHGLDASASQHLSPLRICFHRHFYALGEHFNSVVPLKSS